jgi:hypothetical protein
MLFGYGQVKIKNIYSKIGLCGIYVLFNQRAALAYCSLSHSNRLHWLLMLRTNKYYNYP